MRDDRIPDHPDRPMRLVVQLDGEDEPVVVVGMEGWLVRSFDWWTYAHRETPEKLWVVAGRGPDGRNVRLAARCDEVASARLEGFPG